MRPLFRRPIHAEESDGRRGLGGADEVRTEGREQGLGPLRRLFERKLSRPLTAEEHAELLKRLDTHGSERLGDVVLDLPPEALKAWLADPKAP